MQGRLTNSFNALDRQKRRQDRFRLLQAGVVALATMLLLLMVFARKPEGYVAIVEVQGEGIGSNPTAVEAWLRSPEVVQTASRNLLDSSRGGRRREKAPREDLVTFRQRFQLTSQSQVGEAPHFCIEFTGSSPAQALQGAAELATLVEVDFEPFQQATRVARFDGQLKELNAKYGQLQMARSDNNQLVERLRHEQLAATMLLARQPTAATTKVVTEHPRWTQMREELNQLLVTRMQLVAKLLPNHPQVEQLDLQISALRQQIRAIPQAALNDPSSDLGMTSKPGAQTQQVSHRVDNNATPSAGVTGVQLLDRLDAEMDEAQSKMAQIAKQERQIQSDIEQLRRQAVSQVTQCVWSSASPRIVKQLGGRSIDPTLFGMIAVASGCMGIGFVALSQRSPGAMVLWNLPEAQASLCVPVIGVVSHVSVDMGSDLASGKPSKSWSRLLATAASGVVALFVFAWIATACLDVGHFSGLGEKPLETLLHAASIWLPLF